MITTTDWKNVPIYRMENDELIVYLCPAIGNNIYRIWDKVKERELLRVPESPEQLLESPVHYGTPILIPPNRISAGKFTFQDREYQLEVNPLTGLHIHGLVKSSPWKVTAKSDNGEEQSITSVLETNQYPEMMAQIPHHLVLEMTITLKGNSISQSLRATNRSELDVPFGYGLHTWFMLDGRPEQWQLKLPVESIWELTETLVPTGNHLPLEELAPLTSMEGLNLKGADLDTVFFNGSHEPKATLVNASEGLELQYSGSENFKHWVIYTKGEADQFICLEPYTWVTDAPNLDMDPQVTGFKAISPGDTLTMTMVLDVIHHDT